MNITSQINTQPIATVVNPPTDSLRRDNLHREVITQPAAVAQSAAEKGTASDKDKAKTPAQNNEHIDFANIKKQAELANSTVSDQTEQDPQEKNNQQEQPVAEQNEQAKKTSEQDDDKELSPQDEFAQQQEINELSQRDREVRSHEQAHAAVGGAHTGSPNYEFTIGPDGKKYATEGEVSVDLSPVSGNPQATITKLQKVHAAALAPANPSVQDTKVAAQAARLILQAQSELLAQKLENPTLAGQSIERAPSNVNLDQLNSSGATDNQNDSASFDQLINATLNAQEQIAPSRSEEVSARAGRIENFYQSISKAYDKPPSSHFKLSA